MGDTHSKHHCEYGYNSSGCDPIGSQDCASCCCCLIITIVSVLVILGFVAVIVLFATGVLP